ncbi:ribonucleotide reductase, partial [Xanthomonas citri pv. citri]|nr:ribonucleotide reductase [Xanthomonas citri pv. citri]
ELFTPEFFEDLKTLSSQAFEAECGILDWIFEEGDLSFISREEVENYIRSRYNNSLMTLGLEPPYDVNPELLKETEWFDIEILSTKETDF